MSQWAFLFLQDRCTGCGTCVMACKAWNHPRRGDADIYSADRVGTVPAFRADPDDARGTMREQWRRVSTSEQGSCPTNVRITHLSVSCMHCSMPECMAICPQKRIIKDSISGAVMTDTQKNCISCGLCRRACPWEAPQFCTADTRPLPMTKCDFCYERIIQGLKPACAAACPMRALAAGPEQELLAQFPQAIRYTQSPKNGGQTLPHLWIVPRK